MNAPEIPPTPLSTLSVVIPTLDAGAGLDETLRALGDPALLREIIIADGGSTDDTMAIATAHGCRIVSTAPGRGRQLAAGAAAARGNWLLFLHGDTRLDGNWRSAISRHMADGTMVRCAGVFTLRFAGVSAQARRVAALANWRTRVFALPYGDQGLLIGRDFYAATGGFRPLQIMEDVDFVRRIGRSHIAILEGVAITSQARYLKDGWWARPLKNLGCLALYFLGVPNAWIARLYR
ncbi:TIGR04283 family arsenosugar biosynthesis glycosyltransferase [Varunaivibrio sulfuroxidans]|uniref:RSAM/selenodomain-associated transferase 2 n=1 Tax=Varunaivibrio sulfuroxidans TaxID=1773489 RepID=A0A4R3JBY5_9PROT|nr:TIGR04283 family arsenosugar biosynthesis glycosyltransferase [Varunaivibrio sulfuroxidans]TCS63549.1 rSAM/selenodomain-associated transferase 2 [Varunaivibrio sulfuroxidans]WES30306.1 TIGR04283 family arsenosugar biosynthesis glycosyltransferase [Varunaivibrio sulfuroxidans]